MALLTKKGKKKKEFITLTFTNKEMALIKNAAKLQKMTINEWIDDAVIEMIDNIQATINQ